MKIMFFDTETTGFYQPAVVQIGMIIGEYNENGDVIKEEKIDLRFNPKKSIHPDATKVHGLSMNDVKDKPVFKSFMKDFVLHVKNVDIVVGHNVSYDVGVIESEIKRMFSEEQREMEGNVLSFLNELKEKSFCTMKSSTDYCKLPSKKRGSYKNPKLNELYELLFEKTFENAHDAMADISATKDCFFELKKRNIL